MSLSILGRNYKTGYYRVKVPDLVQFYDVVGCTMSFKVHFFDLQRDIFPENLGSVNDEY